jgi:hypothetical protein
MVIDADRTPEPDRMGHRRAASRANVALASLIALALAVLGRTLGTGPVYHPIAVPHVVFDLGHS